MSIDVELVAWVGGLIWICLKNGKATKQRWPLDEYTREYW